MEDTPKTSFTDDQAEVKLAKMYYEREAIFAAAEKLTDRYYVNIHPLGEQHVEVVIKPKEEGQRISVQHGANKFCNDVLDQQVRLDLEKRNGSLKKIIYKQAFSPLG